MPAKIRHWNFMVVSSPKRLNISGQVAFRHPEYLWDLHGLINLSFMGFLPMCCRFLFTKHFHVLQQEHATKFASTSWNESNLSGFPKMCRYGSRGQAKPVLEWCVGEWCYWSYFFCPHTVCSFHDGFLECTVSRNFIQDAYIISQDFQYYNHPNRCRIFFIKTRGSHWDALVGSCAKPVSLKNNHL